MAEPIPYVVAQSGSAGTAPEGAIPIGLYGGGGGGGVSVDSVNGQVGVVQLGIDDIPDLTEGLADKLPISTFTTYQQQAGEAFEGLESAVQVNTNNLTNTTETANSAVQPADLRLPILLTQAQYDALVVAGSIVPGQIYVTTEG